MPKQTKSVKSVDKKVDSIRDGAASSAELSALRTEVWATEAVAKHMEVELRDLQARMGQMEQHRKSVRGWFLAVLWAGILSLVVYSIGYIGYLIGCVWT